MLFEAGASISLRRGVIVNSIFSAAESMALQHHISATRIAAMLAVASHFGDKASTWFQHAADFGHHGVLVADLMQRGIGENRIEGWVRNREVFSALASTAVTPRLGAAPPSWRRRRCRLH